MKALIFSILLFNNAYALTLNKEKSGRLNGLHYQVSEVKGLSTLFLGPEKHLKKSIAADSPVQDFLSIAEIKIKKKNYLITKWLKGAHGETVRILDKKGNQLYRFNSSWPIKLKVKNDRVEILGHIGTSTENPQEVTKYWSP